MDPNVPGTAVSSWPGSSSRHESISVIVAHTWWPNASFSSEPFIAQPYHCR